MADTTFTDHVTVVLAAWLNDVNNWTYRGTFSTTQLKAPNGSAAVPPYSFSGALSSGMSISGTTLQFSSNSTLSLSIAQNGNISIPLDTAVINLGVGATTRLYWDGAGQLGLRNGPVGQAFYVYNTFTDAANYERGNFGWSSNTLVISSQNAGTGTNRSIQLRTDGTGIIGIWTNGTARWNFNDTGMMAATDNTFDIGATAATRPRSIYWGTQALGPNGSATTPTLAVGATTRGIYGGTTLGGFVAFTPAVAGEIMAITSQGATGGVGGLSMTALGYFGWSSGAAASTAAPDVTLFRDAANVLALRNTTTAQAFRVYNTFTDASNYERAFLGYSGNTLILHHEFLGTGALRNIQIGNASGTNNGNLLITTAGVFQFSKSGIAVRWSIDANGMWVPGAHNTYDIGTPAVMVRNVYIKSIAQVGNAALKIEDTDASHVLTIAAGSNLSADRTFTLTTGDAARTLTMSTDITLDQGIAVASSPTFVSLSLTGTLTVAGASIPQNSQSIAYTLVAADANKHIYHPTSDNNARTFTIPANASVAYTIGTAITFVNDINTVTIAINSDTLVLAGTGTTGSRTLAAQGVATAIKVTATRWLISGTGLT